MCFKITPAQREYFRYQGVSAELERRGYGSSRPELSWANRQDQKKLEKPGEDQNDGLDKESFKTPDSN